jgi:hypothetical protein
MFPYLASTGNLTSTIATRQSFSKKPTITKYGNLKLYIYTPIDPSINLYELMEKEFAINVDSINSKINKNKKN